MGAEHGDPLAELREDADAVARNSDDSRRRPQILKIFTSAPAW